MIETVLQVLAAVRKYRNSSKASIHLYLNKLGIKPLGARQRPQPYPEGTTARVLEYLGLNGNVVPPDPKRAERAKAQRTGVPSLEKLLSERKKAKGERKERRAA